MRKLSLSKTLLREIQELSWNSTFADSINNPSDVITSSRRESAFSHGVGTSSGNERMPLQLDVDISPLSRDSIVSSTPHCSKRKKLSRPNQKSRGDKTTLFFCDPESVNCSPIKQDRGIKFKNDPVKTERRSACRLETKSEKEKKPKKRFFFMDPEDEGSEMSGADASLSLQQSKSILSKNRSKKSDTKLKLFFVTEQECESLNPPKGQPSRKLSPKVVEEELCNSQDLSSSKNDDFDTIDYSNLSRFLKTEDLAIEQEPSPSFPFPAEPMLSTEAVRPEDSFGNDSSSVVDMFGSSLGLGSSVEESLSKSLLESSQLGVTHLPGPLIGLDPVYWSEPKLDISTISRLRESQSVPGVFLISNHPFTRVEIVGIVIGVDKRDKYSKYEVDDSSGAAIHCMHWTPPSPVEIGDLVCIRGRITTFRAEREIKVFQIFKLSDMNELTIHLIQSQHNLDSLKVAFVPPDLAAIAEQMEANISKAILENVIQKGPCANLSKYRELRYVNEWLQCIEAAVGVDQDQALAKISSAVQNYIVTEERSKRRDLEAELRSMLQSRQQVTRVSLRQKYPDLEDQISCVLSNLLMSGDVYEIEPGVFGLV